MGALIGVPTLRLRGDYIAIVTLAFANAAYAWFFHQRIFNAGHDAARHERGGTLPRRSSFEPGTARHMANTPQAKKRIRRNANRALINGARVSRIRTFIKAVESAVVAGNKDLAADALKKAQPEMARGVARGVLHKNTASRKFSRLTKSVAAL